MPADRPDPLFLELQTGVAGRYSLEREIGRGGMGIVYLARDVTLDRPVAIKLLPPELGNLPGVRDRFLREARTAARLSHPNIVPIHAVEEAGRLVYFVMAYVPGETLGARVRRQGPVPAGEAGRILRDVAWALAHAHQQGVVHRDIKADNILLEAGHRTLVTDFGIATVAGGAEDESSIAGTVAYMSPEQARGEPVDGRSDLYALGVVGYLMLSGTLPDPVATLEQLRRRHAAGPPASLGSAAPHAPRALCRAIERCLQSDPDNRFQTAEEFAAALDQLAAGPSELPAPLRAWLTGEAQARTGLVIWATAVSLPAIGVIVAAIRFGYEPVGVLIALGVSGTIPWLLYGGVRLARTRKLLSAGYTHADLILALRNQAERRREELTFEIGRPPSRLGRWLRRGTWAAFAAAIAGVVIPAAVPGWDISAVLWLGIASIAVAGSAVGMIFPGRPLPAAKEGPNWRERLWAGPIGRFVVRLAGWRLGRRSAPELTLHRPTEIALGEAAKALFQALPAPYRKDLAGLPEQAEILSKRAQQLRHQIEELDDLIAQAAPSTMFDGPRPAGDGGAAALTSTRELLARHLANTVTLLESLRVGLLKLHAGTSTPETITLDLTAARDLESRLAGLAEARDDLRGPLPVADRT